MGEGRQMIERLYERVDANDLEGALALFAPDAEFTFPGARAQGRDEIALFIGGHWQAFPSHGHRVLNLVESGGRVAVEAEAWGVQDGPMVTPSGTIPATGRRVTLPICHFLVLEGGLIASSHIWFDTLDMLSQLGAAPAPAGV